MQILRVLIVERELIISEYLSDSLQEKGFAVIGTPLSIDEAIEEFRGRRPDLLIVDIQCGGQPEIIEAAQKIRAEFQTDLPIVFLTTFSVEWSQHDESEPYLTKPFSEIDLYTTIESALGRCTDACNEV